MAEEFGADLTVAAALAKDLREIRDGMNDLGGTFDRYSGATGSARLDQELQRFFDKSSDSRKALDALLERSSKMLQGLVDGATAVDKSLYGSLTTKGSPE